MELVGNDTVKLNVGGTLFMTKADTLRTFPDSKLANLSKDDAEYDMRSDWFFFDRNPIVFHHLLDCYRTGELHLPAHLCYTAVKREFHYWQLDADTVISTCCMGTYQEMEEKKETMDKIYRASLSEIKEKVNGYACDASKPRAMRNRMWVFLEYPSTKGAKLWTCSYSILVVASLILYVMMTCPEYIHVRHILQKTELNLTYDVHLGDVFVFSHLWLIVVDIILNLIFTADFSLRLYSAPDRRKFLFRTFSILEIICLLSYWLYIAGVSLAFLASLLNPVLAATINFTLLVQILRMVRCFKLSRTLVELRALLLSLQHSILEIFITMLLIVSAMFLFSILIYYVEWDAESGFFRSIPAAFWWAIITITTVGYGDVHPTTYSGYAVGAFCALCGVLLTGLSVSILSNNLQLYYDYTRRQERTAKLLDEKTFRSGKDYLKANLCRQKYAYHDHDV